MELDLVLTDSLYSVQSGLGARVGVRRASEVVTVIFHEVCVVARTVAVGWWEPHKQWEFAWGGANSMCL